MQKWRQWETADDADWQLAIEREAVIRPLAGQGKLSQTLIQEATRQLHQCQALGQHLDISFSDG